MTQDKLLKHDLLKTILSLYGKDYDLEQVIEETNKMYEGVALYQIECENNSEPYKLLEEDKWYG
jgi:hypothetical protein